MTAVVATELIAELDGAIKGGSPERRTQMLQQMTHLFLSRANRLDQHQVGVFAEVLIRLIEGAEPDTLAPLSSILSCLTSAPKEVVRRLARHQEVTVAAPILLNSEAVSESDLIEIASARGQQHLLAIAGRKTLGTALTDALLKPGDIVVCRKLARNAGARFSDQGCLKVVAAAKRDGDVADALAVRLDMSVKALQELLTGSINTAEVRFLAAEAVQASEKNRQVTDSIPAGMSAKALPEPTDYSESKSRILALSHAGKLSDSAVNRFAVHRERTNLIAALSLLADAPIETIEPLLSEGNCHGLIVACRASRLNWQTTFEVINSRSDPGRPTSVELEQGKELFETLCLSVAQRTIRFGSVRDFVELCLRANASPAARAS